MMLKMKLKEILNMEINNHDKVIELLPNLLRTIDESNQSKKPTHRGKRTKKSKKSKSTNSDDKKDLTDVQITNDIDIGECVSNILRINLGNNYVEENNLQHEINDDEKIVKAKKPTHRGRRTKKSKKTKVENNDEYNFNEMNINSMLKNNEITIELIENTTNELNNLNINKLNDENDESININCPENTDKSMKNKKPTHRGKRTKKNKQNCDNLKEENHRDIDEKIINFCNNQSNETSIYKMNFNNLKNDYNTTETIENSYIFDTKNKIFSSNNHQAYIESQGQIIQIPPEITITPVQKKPQEIIENLPKNDEQVLLKLKKPTHRGKRTKRTKSTKENESNEANIMINDEADQDNQLGNRKRKSKIIDSLEKLDDEVVDKIDEYFTNLIYEPESFTKLKVENDAKNYTVLSKIAFTNVIRLFFIHAKVPTTEPNLSSAVFRFMHTIIDIHKGRFDMTDVFLTVCEEFFPMGSFNLIALVGYLCAKKWLSLTFLIKCIEYYFTYISESNALFLCVLIKTVEENYDTEKLINQYWNRFKSITISEKKDLKLVAAIEKFNSTKDVWSLLPK